MATLNSLNRWMMLSAAVLWLPAGAGEAGAQDATTALGRARAAVAGGALEAAESLYTVAAAELEMGNDAHALVAALLELGQVQDALGSLDAAAASYRRALDQYGRRGLPRDDRYAAAAVSLGTLLIATNDLVGAEGVIEEAIEVLERLHGPDDRALVPAVAAYADLQRARGRDDLAELATRRARTLMERSQVSAVAAAAATPAPAEPAGVPIEPGRVYTLADSLNGRPLVTTPPSVLDCPRYDPSQRPTRQRVGDRYEREGHLGMEGVPTKIEAVLELVIGLDGKAERKLTKVLRTTDRRMDDEVISWVHACQFHPGRIGEKPVRVRIEFPMTLEIRR